MKNFEFLTLFSASNLEPEFANECENNIYINGIAFINKCEGRILVKFSQIIVSKLGINAKNYEFFIDGPEECEFIQVNVKEEWCKRLIITKICDYLDEQLTYVNIN